MRKYYLINKITGILDVFDTPHEVAAAIWGRDSLKTVLVVSEINKDCLIPLSMTSGNVADIEKMLEYFEGNF
jgi:hypothetical protein